MQAANPAEEEKRRAAARLRGVRLGGVRGAQPGIIRTSFVVTVLPWQSVMMQRQRQSGFALQDFLQKQGGGGVRREGNAACDIHGCNKKTTENLFSFFKVSDGFSIDKTQIFRYNLK